MDKLTFLVFPIDNIVPDNGKFYLFGPNGEELVIDESHMPYLVEKDDSPPPPPPPAPVRELTPLEKARAKYGKAPTSTPAPAQAPVEVVDMRNEVDVYRALLQQCRMKRQGADLHRLATAPMVVLWKLRPELKPQEIEILMRTRWQKTQDDDGIPHKGGYPIDIQDFIDGKQSSIAVGALDAEAREQFEARGIPQVKPGFEDMSDYIPDPEGQRWRAAAESLLTNIKMGGRARNESGQ